MGSLVIYEENLERIANETLNLKHRIVKMDNNAIIPRTLCFNYNETKYGTDSLSKIIDSIDLEHKRIKNDFNILKGYLANNQFEILEKEKLDFDFIDYFYCIVERSKLKDFKKNIKDSQILIVENATYSIFKVFTLKKDIISLINTLSKDYIIQKKESKNIVGNNTNIEAILSDLINLEFHISMVLGLIEALHCYGLPLDFYYKIKKSVNKKVSKNIIIDINNMKIVSQ